MRNYRTPALSEEGSKEVSEEMQRAPTDSPERRETFKRARAMTGFVQRLAATATGVNRRSR